MGEAKGKDKEMKTFKEISQGLKTRYYKKAVATNRHGSASMKVDTARHFGKPGDAKKAQDRYHSISNKMATARPAGESADVKEISQGLKTRYYKKAVATNRHGNTQMKVDTARIFGKPGDAKKAQDRADSVRSKMATVRPATESVEETVNELDTSTLVSYRKKANKQRYSNNISKRIQRTAGVDRADKKLRARNIDKFGDHSPKGVDKMGNPKEDSDAVKAFLAKGGKIKKLPPGKAAGWHGKDDAGKDVHGMINKPDTKAMPTRKKIGSMK